MEIKFWYGGVKHTAKDEAEQIAMIEGFQDKGVDPYDGLLKTAQQIPNEMDLLKAQVKEQASQIKKMLSKSNKK